MRVTATETNSSADLRCSSKYSDEMSEDRCGKGFDSKGSLLSVSRS